MAFVMTTTLSKTFVKTNCAFLCCANLPPSCPPAGTQHPEGNRGGKGERRGRDPRPRTRAKRGRTKTGAKWGGGGLHDTTEADLL